MKEDLKSYLKPLVQEFISGEIIDRKLFIDGENYLQWRKIVEVHMRGRGKKRYLTEPSPESMIDEWEGKNAQLFSLILNSLE